MSTAGPARGRDTVRVTGPDTWTFLQSLLSQDVANLADGDSLPTLLLTPQGKVDVVGVISRVGDDAVIGAGTVITRSIIFGGVKVGENASLTDSIVGLNYEIAAGETLTDKVVAYENTPAAVA